jgi:hypothetical protein
LIADELKLPQDACERIRWASLLHDIGKLEVPPRILNKPGKPTPSEWAALQRHPEEGARIAQPLLAWLGEQGNAISQHHERYDGTGYPLGPLGEEISLAARVVSVADSFEVMTAARTYKRPMSVSAAREELARCAGSQFSPEVVRAFFNISIGRLWWTVGPASWIALIPYLGQLQRSGEQVMIAMKSAAIVASLGATSVLEVAPAAVPPLTRSGGAADPAVPLGPALAPTGGSGGGTAGGGGRSGGGGAGGGTKDGGGTRGGGGTSDPGSGSGGSDDPDGATRPITDTVSGIDTTIDDLVGTTVDTVSETTDAVGTTVSDVAGGLLP